MIFLRSIRTDLVLGETEDGFNVRIDIKPDENGRMPLLVTGPGMSVATTAASLGGAVALAERIITEKRQGQTEAPA